MRIFNANELAIIARTLQSGDVVALPTETVFGLAVALSSPSAVSRLIALKNRPLGSGKFFTLVPEHRDALENYVRLPASSRSFIEQNIPGSLTAILPKNPAFRHPYYDQLDKIGVRIPDTYLFYKLLYLSGPLILTSANPRDLPPAKTIAEVENYFGENIDAIVDDPAGGQLPSTVVDFTTKPPAVLREGLVKLQ